MRPANIEETKSDIEEEEIRLSDMKKLADAKKMVDIEG